MLGDYINRGPESKKVVDLVIQLMNDGYQVYPLKGNHEELAQMGYDLQKTNMERSDGKLMDRYNEFFEGLYYYIELEDTLLVHAGFNLNSDNPFEDYQSMLWNKKDFRHTNPEPFKRIIHGHQTKPLDRIQTAIKNREMWIPLENGCYQKNRSQYGDLCCLDLYQLRMVI